MNNMVKRMVVVGAVLLFLFAVAYAVGESGNVGEPICGHMIRYENAFYLAPIPCDGIPAPILADPATYGYIRFALE